MHNTVTANTEWDATNRIVTTLLCGPVDIADVERWEAGLHGVLQSLPAGTHFKTFVNFHGLAPVSVEAHKRYRSVIPATLARYGWRVGYLAMFPEADGLAIATERDVRCVAAVHVHQDAYKIEEYDRRFGTAAERFFTDTVTGAEWLASVAA